MYKNIPSEIKKHTLDTDLHRLHKAGKEKSDFGMDSTSELVDGGFGLYSSADLKSSIGPVKTEYFRIALLRKGSATVNIGLESFHPVRNSIIFGFPGQVFSIDNMSPDFFNYYLLFNEKFIAASFNVSELRNKFLFLGYAGVQCFQLGEEEAMEIEKLVLEMNEEVHTKRNDMSNAIRMYIQLILIKANRTYVKNIFSTHETSGSTNSLFTRFIKSVSEHFLTHHKVADYAQLLHVSADHLNRTIKAHTAKTAGELIDDMILMEAKADLKHSTLSVAEIAYRLHFSDPSHFNKFFKKLMAVTPQQYRGGSE